MLRPPSPPAALHAPPMRVVPQRNWRLSHHPQGIFQLVPRYFRWSKASDLKDRGRDGKSNKVFPLTARRIDMGNTMRIDMGNTFCALRRPATHFLREAELLHTSSQTPSIGPLGACDEVCSSSCGTGEISLQTIEVLPMCVLKVLPMSMRATHPGPLPEERENHSAHLEGPSAPRRSVV